jgi:hypothetical protein
MSRDIQTMKKTSGMIDLVARSKGSFFAPRAVIKSIEVLAPEAVSVLEDLMRNSKVDSVRLKAATEVLELAGISKETRINITTDTRGLSNSEVDARLNALLGIASGTVLESQYVDVTPKEETHAESTQEIKLQA